jgi:hypothetical protein
VTWSKIPTSTGAGRYQRPARAPAAASAAAGPGSDSVAPGRLRPVRRCVGLGEQRVVAQRLAGAAGDAGRPPGALRLRGELGEAMASPWRLSRPVSGSSVAALRCSESESASALTTIASIMSVTVGATEHRRLAQQRLGARAQRDTDEAGLDAGQRAQ